MCDCARPRLQFTHRWRYQMVTAERNWLIQSEYLLADAKSTESICLNDGTYGVGVDPLTSEHNLNLFIVPPCVCQTIHEEKTSHEKDMGSMQAHYEEEASQMKDGQARALEEVAKKHRVTLENALTNAEKDKNRLLAVSTRTVTHQQADIHSSSRLSYDAEPGKISLKQQSPFPGIPLMCRYILNMFKLNRQIIRSDSVKIQADSLISGSVFRSHRLPKDLLLSPNSICWCYIRL